MPRTLRNTFRLLSLLLFILCIAIAGAAQDTLLSVSYKGRLDSIQSSILKQKRYVQVFLPQGYKESDTQKYDVLYVLDGGNWNISLAIQLQRFLENEGKMPPTIIVSIMGIDRNPELTPTQLKSWQAPTGEADNFLAFIKKELIPHINNNYPSNDDNTLWGHSLGGMFVVYAMLKEPGTFKSYIAADPSLWWDNGFVTKLAATRLPALTDSTITLFICGRQGPAFHEMGIDTMENILKTAAPKNIKWELVSYKDETHSSLRLKSFYEGLKFTYAGFRTSMEFFPSGGIIEKDRPFKIWYFDDDPSRTRYTTDGTVPTASSHIAEREIVLAKPSHVIFKRLTNRARYDKQVAGDFIAGEALKPVSKPKHSLAGGLRYSYYEGSKDELKDLTAIKPLETGIINKNLDHNKLPRKKDYLLIAEGSLEVKEDGYYIFYFKSGTGSRLFVGKQMIIEWKHSDVQEALSYIVPLKKGFYSVKAEYFNKKGDAVIPLYYITPSIIAGADAVPIPADVEYSVTQKR